MAIKNEKQFEAWFTLQLLNTRWQFAEHLIGSNGQPDITATNCHERTVFIECKHTRDPNWRDIQGKEVFTVAQPIWYHQHPGTDIRIVIYAPDGVWYHKVNHDISLLYRKVPLNMWSWDRVNYETFGTL